MADWDTHTYHTVWRDDDRVPPGPLTGTEYWYNPTMMQKLIETRDARLLRYVFTWRAAPTRIWAEICNGPDGRTLTDAELERCKADYAAIALGLATMRTNDS